MRQFPFVLAMVMVSSFAAFGRLRPSARLGRYVLDEIAGRGGTALVWEAHDPNDGERVAIKTMLPSVLSEQRLVDAFVREREIAPRLEHEHICRVIEAAEEDGIAYLVMEWVDGASLASLTHDDKQRPRPSHGVAARIIADVARGLHAAHEADLIHRDVSPQNILVGRDGIAKIADFGVAKLTSEAGKTVSGVVKGKARYMAPEQAFCESVDRRTDVFALGVVLYEATTGRLPFDAETDVRALASLMSADEAKAPDDPNYPPALSEIVMRALSKDAAARFESANDLAEALEKLSLDDSDHEAVARWVTTSSKKAPRPQKKRTSSVGLVIVGALAVTLILLVYRTLSWSSSSPTPIATTPAVVVVSPPASSAPVAPEPPPPSVASSSPPAPSAAKPIARSEPRPTSAKSSTPPPPASSSPFSAAELQRRD
jgi:eukaryotic-like serine/threonine-protein kinase